MITEQRVPPDTLNLNIF